MPSLADLQPGQSATIGEVRVAGPQGVRLLELGLLPGTVVTLTRRAPLGDPLQIQMRGYWLSLRRDDAMQVVVNLKA